MAARRHIDAHTHVFPNRAGLAVRVMDRCGIRCSVTLGWEDAFGGRLDEQLRAFAGHPGRFAPLCNIDFSRVDSQDFGQQEADSLERAVEKGCHGLKIFKSLGLSVRTGDGELLRVDDPRLDPVFERAAELGVPVLIHTADPAAFWQPPGPDNFWGGVLDGEYAGWSYYRKGLPSREELLGERDRLLSRHPQTIFVAPHLASLADDPLALAESLERHPNLYVDISARLPAMARTEARRRTWRETIIRFADRVLFGTDLIYDDQGVAAGIQSQSFQRPGEADTAGLPPEEAFLRTSAAYLDSHLRFLTSEETQEKAPFRRQQGTFRLAGLGLEGPVLEKVLQANAARIYGIS
ncbi:MAG: amidohydrolase family protein [Candidatus Glassbacteria bacterium]|nr:amidohydrolase family protein [Candidatus Glassbacteria bacterium]